MDSFRFIGISAYVNLIAWVLAHLLCGVSADCYNRNGQKATDTKEYDGGAELVSCGRGTNNCCMPGDKCGSNLLCYGADDTFAREYCAVFPWTNCSTLAPEFKAAGIGLTDCGQNAVTYGGVWNCTTGVRYFVDPDTGAVEGASTRSSTRTVTLWSVDSASILASSTILQSSITSITAVATPTTSRTTVSSTIEPPATITSLTGGSSSTPLVSGSSTSQLSAGAGAGIGIGCAAAVAGILISTWLWRRERKKRRLLQRQTQQQQPVTSPQMNPPMYQAGLATKTIYAHSQDQERTREIPTAELADSSRNEAP